MKDYSTTTEAIEAHRAWLAMRRSPGAVTKYAQHLRALNAWAGDRPFGELTAREIEFEFLGPWSVTVSKPTLRNRIAALRSLYDFAERFDLVDRNIMRRIEPPPRDDRMGDWLRHDEDAAVLAATVSPIERIIPVPAPLHGPSRFRGVRAPLGRRRPRGAAVDGSRVEDASRQADDPAAADPDSATARLAAGVRRSLRPQHEARDADEGAVRVARL